MTIPELRLRLRVLRERRWTAILAGDALAKSEWEVMIEETRLAILKAARA